MVHRRGGRDGRKSRWYGWRAGALPSKGVNHWPLFWAALIPAYLVNAATSSSWSMAVGYVAVPSLLGLFLIRKASTWQGLAPGYLVFMGFLFILVGKDAFDTLQDTRASIKDGCMTRNAEVAMLPSETQKNTYCSCVSEKMAWPVLRHAGVVFLTFRKPEPIQSNQSMMSTATEVAKECAARI